MTQHPTPEPVTGGIDIEKEAERFALSLLNHPSKFTAESIKSITEAFVGSLCDRVRQEEQEKYKWVDGYPPKPWAEEWFIAITIYGDRVVLRSLPEEYTYDFKTADGTYMKRENIKCWMQFPDSNYISPIVAETKI